VTPFHERAEQMGLDITHAEEKGMYSYNDLYGEVIYRQLATKFTNIATPSLHETDGLAVPKLGIFTKKPEWIDYKYAGCVSDMYKFIGNDVLNQKIREAILSVGMPILEENTILDDLLTRMRNEIIIQSSQNVPNAGDVLPVMIVNNSYNGTRAATIAFGITMDYDHSKITFAFTLGELRQVHIESSMTSVTSAVNSYMQVFTDSILDMITQSFESRVTEDEMLTLLDVIEGYGKKRREGISALLDNISPESGLPSAWQIFLAIVCYSSFEPNLNIKRLLENAAESVLVIPPRMYEVLDRLQSS